VSTQISNDTFFFSHERQTDGRIAITAHLPGGDKYVAEPFDVQEPEQRLAYLDKLCGEYPGIDRKDARAELVKIAQSTRIDLRFEICGKINGRVQCSARLWRGAKFIDAVPLNLLDSKACAKAVEFLAPLYAGREASKKKLHATMREMHKRFKDEAQRLLTTPAAAQPRTVDHDHCPYYFDGRGIVMKSKDGEVVLSNFGGRIAAIVTRNDGQEAKSDFELEITTTGGVKRSIVVKVKEFGEMKWPVEQLYDEGYIHPDRNASSHVRAAIMQFSRNPKPERRMIYTHTGWLRVDDRDYYLHAGGAIAAEAEPPKIEVQVHKALARYVLPAPPAESVGLKACVRASLRLLELAPPRIVFPLYSALYRSVLGSCDSGTFIVGPSGAFKSELTALFAQHFGAGLDKTHLPANWSSTPNALELVAFACKDAILPIDDFAPCGNRNQIDALHGTADRLFRAQGNNSGRQRSSKDAQVDEAKPPRGLIWGTGEDLPRGQSLRARLIAIVLSPGDIKPADLTACQRDARDGLYAGAMAAYIRWLCEGGRIERIRKELRGRIEELRDRAVLSDVHRRTPEVVANLAVALVHFFQFAIEKQVISQEEGDRLWARAWSAIGESAQDQAALQAENDPAKRFLELLASALLSGEMHLSNVAGHAPDEEIAAACGWRKHSESATTWEPQGIWGGCVDGPWGREVYLEFDAAYRACQRAAGGGSDGLVIAAATLRKRLQEKGMLQGADAKRTAVRKRVKGMVRMMVWLAPAAMGVHFARTARTARTDDAEMPFSDPPAAENR
jgi:hypothetical protein